MVTNPYGCRPHNGTGVSCPVGLFATEQWAAGAARCSPGRRDRGPRHTAGVIVLRPAGADDAGFLTDMLVEAVNWPPGRHFSRERVLADPASAHYVAGWPGPGDVGTVAEADGVPVGAAWLRVLPADDPGYGFVAAGVPELSMAVAAGWRGRGIGRRLLRAVVAQARAAGRTGVSLSVEAANPARDLYRSEGFRTVRAEENATVMLLTFH